MHKPFGYTLKINLSLTRSLFNLGPGWAALAGFVSTGYSSLDLSTLLQIIALWILVDPLLGTLWELTVNYRLWQQIRLAQLPPAPATGFTIPYAQTGSVAGRFVLKTRRYRAWWQETGWPEVGDKIVTFFLGSVLALLVGMALAPTIFWLVVLAVGLTLLTGPTTADLSTSGGGRIQSIVQLLLPWLMGVLLALPTPDLPLISVLAAICYWATYLGGLRMLGHHRRAEWLFFGGQVVLVVLLLTLRLLPGAAILTVFLVTQLLFRTGINQPSILLRKAQPFLVIGLIVAAVSLGGWIG